MSKNKDVELAKKGNEKQEGEKSETESDEEELDKDCKDDNVPLFVFLWTYKPWALYRDGHLIPLFITHSIIVCAVGVFLCNAGYSSVACSPQGLIGFIMGILALSKIQMYGNLKLSSEKMQQEINKMKALMAKYENENRALKETLVLLEEQSEELKNQRSNLERFQESLVVTTTDFEKGVREFKRERIELNKSYDDIGRIVDSLQDKEVDLQKRCTILRRELKKLRAHNKAIAETYNNLVEEHECVRQTNDLLAEQSRKFESMREKFINQRDVLKDSMQGNLTGLQSMMENYEILFLQEIAHNAEFSDGKEGMTEDNFAEFLRRIPRNMPVDEDRLLALFEEHANEDYVCDHEAIQHIIVQIVKANTGVPGPLTGDGDIDAKLESAKVDL